MECPPDEEKNYDLNADMKIWRGAAQRECDRVTDDVFNVSEQSLNQASIWRSKPPELGATSDLRVPRSTPRPNPLAERRTLGS
jgi:hypothetical protein